jgi:hypothetical protein
MDPSVSVAVAAMVTLAGAVKDALFAGLSMTEGAMLRGAATVTLTTLEILTAPELSVAFAARL